jgi:phage tail sheath protein FI
MPTFTYPGVYIEEIPSGVHTITGVATSIAAFVGWAARGPVDQATLVESWTDFQNQFGGLDSRSYLGYAVNQFFANGGQQAYIIRVIWDGTLIPVNGSPDQAATAQAAGIGAGATVISAVSGVLTGQANLLVTGSTLTAISVAVTNPTIAMGQTVQLSATGTFADGTTQDLTSNVTWVSATTAAATVNNRGLVTGAGAGSSVVTATFGAVSGQTTVTVTGAVVQAITVTPVNAPWLQTGQTQQYTATGLFSDGTTQDLSNSATWSASPAAVATVGATGLGTAVGVGTATIMATSGGVSGSAPLKVTAANLSLISVTPASPSIASGQTCQFTATGIYSDNTTQDLTASVNWTSGTPATATISNGGLATVVGAADATTVITATLGAKSGTTTLTVSKANLSTIAVTPANPTIAKGQTLQLTATGTYSDSTTQDLTRVVNWSTGTPATAAIDASGVATGAGTGSSVITASLSGVSGTTNLTVGLPALKEIVVTAPNPPWIAAGQTKQYTATGNLSDGTTQDLTNSVTWNSSSPAVATVSTTGLATAVGGGGTLTLFARNPGQWANSYLVNLTLSSDPTRFTLDVRWIKDPRTNQVVVVESFPSLSVNPADPRYVVTVVNTDSQYVTFVNPKTSAIVAPSGTPASTPTPVPLSGGQDGATLRPGDGNFEVALGSDPAATNDYGIHLLDRIDLFNLLCVPGETDAPTIQNLQAYCVNERAFLIVDAPQLATTATLRTNGPVGSTPGSITGQNSTNAAFYYPWVQAPDPLAGNRPAYYPPCGFVAGIYARTDANRGVWKAPAGIEASLSGVSGLQYLLTDQENGDLNVQGINCLRQFKVYGDLVWGARTLQGSDQAGSDWKYVPIRRFALFLESSLYDGTQWVVFEPNDERLWGQIRLNVGAFMQGLFLQGAFQGTTPQQAYFVKCDAENNPQPSINQGIVNILVGFAPLYPAEFVVIQIQQLAGQTQT